jgi:hypothetical protein
MSGAFALEEGFMRVRILSGNETGAERDVDAGEAESMIATGFAVAVEDAPEEKPEPDEKPAPAKHAPAKTDDDDDEDGDEDDDDEDDDKPAHARSTTATKARPRKTGKR